MNAQPLVDFGNPRPDRRPVTIRPTRDMILLRAGETLARHCDEGQLATVERHTLAMLADDDYEITGTPAPAIEDHRKA